MKERAIDPRMLNVAQLCHDAGSLAGQWPLAGMKRLRGGLFEQADSAVNWSASGALLLASSAEPEIWLKLRADVVVTLQCQRCLQSVVQPLAVDRRLRFVRSEAEAERLDEASDFDVLVLLPRLDLHDLVEDELILALPLVPRHEERCPVPLPIPVDDLPDEAPAPKPFAALAVLRNSRRGDKI